MRTSVDILGKTVHVSWSSAADKAMRQLQSPLLVEMELLFSCLIRKRVRFRTDVDPAKFVYATPQLKVGFRPVMTKVCLVSDVADGAVPVQDFPIKKAAAFVPRQLFVDYRDGQWRGEFQIAAMEN